MDITLKLKTTTKLCQSSKSHSPKHLHGSSDSYWYCCGMTSLSITCIVPNTLSCAYLNDCKTEVSSEEIESHVHLMNKLWPMIDLLKKTATDESLKLLAIYIYFSLIDWKKKTCGIDKGVDPTNSCVCDRQRTGQMTRMSRYTMYSRNIMD